MAYDKVVDSAVLDAALTDIADAIRAKTGKSDSMSLDAMPGEIESIPAGGGSTDAEDALIARTITEYNNPRVNTIGRNAFTLCTALTRVDLPQVTSIAGNAFSECLALTRADLPQVSSIGNNAFYGCAALISADFPLVTGIDARTFSGCKALTGVNFPLVTSIGANAFSNCAALTGVDLPLVTFIGANTFLGCSSLTRLVLRNDPGVCTLAGSSAVPDTAYVYVPDALVENYKVATNWSAHADRIKPLSELPEEGEA